MKEKKKYEKPKIKAVALDTISIICSSGNTEQFHLNLNIYNSSDWDED